MKIKVKDIKGINKIQFVIYVHVMTSISLVLTLYFKCYTFFTSADTTKETDFKIFLQIWSG